MITLKAKFVGGDDARRSVTFPRWVHVIYSPAFRLLSFGGGVYSRYLWWWMDQEEKCLANLRQLDLAKRKWASEAQKADRATAWADHIIDYLPKHSMLKCPIGGEYHFKPVGTKPECSYHGDKF